MLSGKAVCVLKQVSLSTAAQAELSSGAATMAAAERRAARLQRREEKLRARLRKLAKLQQEVGAVAPCPPWDKGAPLCRLP
eukprot:2981404-Pyramimonas_sp.AAC.2